MRLFLRRMAIHLVFGGGIILLALGFGMGGYHLLDGRTFSEAFVHAAAPIAGMGLTHIPDHSVGQIFTGVYAIIASFTFVVVSAIIYAPLLHRLLHVFHFREGEGEGGGNDVAEG